MNVFYFLLTIADLLSLLIQILLLLFFRSLKTFPDLFVPQKSIAKQLASAIPVEVKCPVNWRFQTKDSSVHKIIPEVRLIPEKITRLFSPQAFLIQHQSGS